MIGILHAHLYIGQAGSLKEKRRVIKSLVERMRGKFNVSVSEIDLQDNWKQAKIGVVLVGNESSYVDKVLAGVTNFLDSNRDIELVDIKTEVL